MESEKVGHQSQTLTYKRLAALDFDHTIVDDNTDVVIQELINPSQIPENTRTLYKTIGWTRYMQEIFRLLHKNGIRQEDYDRKIDEIKPVKGLIELIKTLNNSYNYDIIIISDSNSFFINRWLKTNGLLANVKQTFTNPASFNPETGLLEIKPYHHQTDCQLSATNMCKGRILEQFLQNQMNRHEPIGYETIFYIGDGSNDACPILKLSRFDYGCARLDYRLDKVIEMVSEKQKIVTDRLQASIIRWTDGDELLRKILNVRINSIENVRTQRRKDISL